MCLLIVLNEECDFDFVDIDNELSAKLDNNQEAACFIFCDGTGESCVFDFEQFNMIAEGDIEMHLKSVLGDDIDSEEVFDVLDVFFDLFDDEKLKNVDECNDVWSICSNIMICLIVWILRAL